MTRIIPNCTCGFAGSDSNCSQDRRPPDCAGCGFDKFEIGKRKYLLREQGLTPVSPERMEYLRNEWGVRVDLELRGLRV